MRPHFRLAIFLVIVRLAPCADLAITGATIYTSPDAQPLTGAVILVHNGKISAVGPSSSVSIPTGTPRVDFAGAFVTAGFWNSHVHILPPELLQSGTAPAAELNKQVDLMFNRWGFTTVFDIGSVAKNTMALRRRIDRGEVQGPRILTTGEPVWTEQPVYVAEFLRMNHLLLPVVRAAAEATRQVDSEFREGVNGIKLFTGSLQKDHVVNMPLDIAKAAASEAHRHHLPVFAHPQDSAGVDIAIRGGVDILAHTAPQAPDWTSAFVPRIIAAHMALIPTLTLFDFEARSAKLPDPQRESWLQLVTGQLRAFSAAGGEVLFGTDIGYTDHFDTGLEFELMSRGGMDYRAILASLTTNPARRFGFAARSGRIAAGMDADLTILDADPARDIAAFSKIQATIRNGVITFRKQ